MKRDGSARGAAGGVPCKLPLARLGALLPRLAHAPPSPAPSLTPPAKPPAMPPPPARALCLYCERTFTSAQLLQKHAARVHLLPPNRRQSSRHSPAPDSFHPGCNLCGKNSGVQTASDLPALFHHFIDKHPTKYFACSTCTLRFSTENILISHDKDIHGVTRANTDLEHRVNETFVGKDNGDPEENICLENDISSKGSGVSDQLTCEVVRYDADNINVKSLTKNVTLNILREVSGASTQDVAGKKNIKGKAIKKTKSLTQKSVDIPLNDVSNHSDALENNTLNSEGMEDFEENIVANLIMPRVVTEIDQIEKHANKKKLLPESNGKKNMRASEPSVSLARLQFKSDSKDSPMLSRLGLTQNRSPRAQSLRRCRKAPVTENRSASEMSRKDKLKAKNNDDFIINKSKNDPSTKFDPDFYCNVSANVRENILEHLDGKLGKANAIGDVPDIIDPKIKSTHAVMPCPQEQPAEIHGSDMRLNAITVFPTLLTSDQYGSDKIPHYSYGAKVQTFKKIITKNSWKWKWDPIKKYKYCNEDGKIVRKIKPLLHMSPRDLSKLDIWTQLSMREKYDKCVESKAPDINEGGKCERQKQINELNTILDSRVFPEIECPETMQHEREEVASLEPEGEKDECNPVLAGLGLVRSGGGAGRDAGPVLTGEWARPRCYVCCVCGRRAPCLRLLQAHQASQHPHVHATHYELVGQELLQTQLYKHLYLPGIRRGLHQVDKTKLRKQSIARQIKSLPRKILNTNQSTRILRTTTRTIKSLERECTKCKKSLLPSELYRHILECAGDYGWIMAKKKCKYKPFGARRRKLKGLYKRERPQDDEDKSEIKERVTRPKLPSRPRTKPSDAETIQRMLANLPAKRASRQIMNIPSPKIRPFLNDNKKQGHIVRHMVSTKSRIQRSKMMCTSSVITVTEGLGKKIRRVTRSVANTVQALQQRNYLRNRKNLTSMKSESVPVKPPVTETSPAEEIIERTSPVPTKSNKMSTIKKKSVIVSTSKSDLTISSKCKKEESLPRLLEEKKSKHYNRAPRNTVSTVEVAITNNEEIKTKKHKLQRILRRRPVLSSKIIDSSKSLKKRTLRKGPLESELMEESSGMDDDIVLAKIDKESFSSEKQPLKAKESTPSVDSSSILPTQKVKKNARKSLGFPLKWIGRKKTRGGKPKENQELENITDDIPETEVIVDKNSLQVPEVIEETSTVEEIDSDKLLNELHKEMSEILDSEPLSNLKSNLQTIITEVSSDPSVISDNDIQTEIVKVSLNKGTKEPDKSSDLIIVASCGNWSNPGFPQPRNTSNNAEKELPSQTERNLSSNKGQTASIVNKEILTNYNQGKYSFQESVEIINKMNSKTTIEPVRPLNNAEEFEIDNIDKPPLFSHVSSIQSKLSNMHQLNQFANYEQYVYSAYELQHTNPSSQPSCLESDASLKHSAKIKAAKSRRGLNDCIAMLKGKLNDKPDMTEESPLSNTVSQREVKVVAISTNAAKTIEKIQDLPLSITVAPTDKTICSPFMNWETLKESDSAPFRKTAFPAEKIDYSAIAATVLPIENSSYFPATNTLVPTENVNYLPALNSVSSTEKIDYSAIMNTELATEKLTYFPVMNTEYPPEKIHHFPVTNTVSPLQSERNNFPVSSAVMLLENKSNITPTNTAVSLEIKHDLLLTNPVSPTEKINYLSVSNTVMPTDIIIYSPITKTTEKINYSPITNTVSPTEKNNYLQIKNHALPKEKNNESLFVNTVFPTEKSNYSPVMKTVLPTDKKNDLPVHYTAFSIEKIKDIESDKKSESVTEDDDDSLQPLDLSGRVPKAEDLSFKSIMEKELQSSLSKVLARKAVYDPTLRIPQYSLGQGKTTTSHTSLQNKVESEKKKPDSSPYNLLVSERKSSRHPQVPSPAKSPPSPPDFHDCPSPPREHKIHNLTSTELDLLPKAFLDKIESLPIHHRNEIFRALPHAFAEAIENMQRKRIAALSRCKTVNEDPKPDDTQHSALSLVSKSEPSQTSGRLTSEISTQTLASAQPTKASQDSPEFTNLDTDHFLIDPVTGSIIERTNIEEQPISLDPQNDLLGKPDNNSPVVSSLPTTDIIEDNVIDLTNESHDIDYPRNSKIEGTQTLTPQTIEQGIDSKNNESPHNTAILAKDVSPKDSHDVQKASPDKGTLSLRSVRIKTTTEKLKQKTFDLQKEESKGNALFGLHPETLTEISNPTPQAEVYNAGDHIDNVNIPTENTISSSKDLGLDSNVSDGLVNVALKLCEPAIQQDEVSSTQHSVAEDSSDFAPSEYVINKDSLPNKKQILPSVDLYHSESNDVVMTDKLDLGSNKQSEHLSILLTPTRTFQNSFKNLVRSTEIIDTDNAGDSIFNEKSRKKISTKRKKGIKPTPNVESKEHCVQTSEMKDSESIPVISEYLEKSGKDFDGKPDTVTCEQQKTSFNKLLMKESNILSETALTPSNVIDFHPVSSEKCETSQINDLNKTQVKEESIVRRSSRKNKSKLLTKEDEKITDKKSETLQNVENCNDVLNPDMSGAAIIPGESCQANLGEAGVSPSRDQRPDSDDEDDVCLAVVAKKKAITVPTLESNDEIIVKESTCTNLATNEETTLKVDKVTGKIKNKTIKMKSIKKSKHKVQSRITRSRFVEAAHDGSAPADSERTPAVEKKAGTESTSLKSIIPLKKRKVKAFEDNAIPASTDVSVLTEEEVDESSVFRSDKLTDEESSQNNDQIASVNYVKLNENGHLIFKMHKKLKKTRQIDSSKFNDKIKDHAKKPFGLTKNSNKSKKEESGKYRADEIQQPDDLSSSVVESDSVSVPVDIQSIYTPPTSESSKLLSVEVKCEKILTRKCISNGNTGNDKNEENKEVTNNTVSNSDSCIPPDDQPLTAFAKTIKSIKKRSSKIENKMEPLENLIPNDSELLNTVVDTIYSAQEKVIMLEVETDKIKHRENEIKSKAGRRKKKSTTTNTTDDSNQENLSEAVKVNVTEIDKESQQKYSKVLFRDKKSACETTNVSGDANRTPVKSSVKEDKIVSDLSSTINESQESPNTKKSRRKSPRDLRKNGETLLNDSNLTETQLCTINKCPETSKDNVKFSIDNINALTVLKINKKSITEGAVNGNKSLEVILGNPKESCTNISNITSDEVVSDSVGEDTADQLEVKEATQPTPGTGKKDKSLAQYLGREDKTAKKLKKSLDCQKSSDVINPETKAKRVSKKLNEPANENLPKKLKGSLKILADNEDSLESPVDENEPLSNSIKSSDLRGSEYVFEDSDFENLSDIAFSYKKLKEKKNTDKIQLKDSKIGSQNTSSNSLDLNISDQLAPLADSKNELMERDKTQKIKSIELAPLADSKNEIIKKVKTQKIKSIELAPLADSKNEMKKKDKFQKMNSIELVPLANSKNEMMKKEKFQKINSIELAPLADSKNEMKKKDKSHKMNSIELTPLADSKNEMMKKDKFQKINSIELTPLADPKNEMIKKDKTQKIKSIEETKHSQNDVSKNNSNTSSNIIPDFIIQVPDQENDDYTVKKKVLRKKLISETAPEPKASQQTLTPAPAALPATGEQMFLDKSNTRRNKQTMTTRAKRISQRRSTLATCESINTNELGSSDDESIIQDKYLANFGMFTEKRPRKSTLLAIKKISQTFRPETSDTDDLDPNGSSQLLRRSERPQKKKTRKVSTNQENVASDTSAIAVDHVSDALKPLAESTPKGATLSQSSQYTDDGLSTDDASVFSKDSNGNEADNYCSICKRKFRRAENLAKHKMTLMHISKLSEMEAKTLKTDEPIEGVIDSSIPSIKPVVEPEVFESIAKDISTRAYKSLAERKSFNNDDVSLECVLSPDKLQPTTPQENLITSKDLLDQSLPEVNSSSNHEASRKTLSCDEALFFECCSLLKESKSTRKDVKIVEPFKSSEKYSKAYPNSADAPVIISHVESANTYELNLPSYAKEFAPRMEDFNPADISVPVGVEEVFYDCTDQIEPFELPTSKSMVYDFDTLNQKCNSNKNSAKTHTIDQDSTSLDQTVKSTVEEMDEKSCGAEFDPYSAESLMVRSNSDDFSDNGDSMLSTHDTEHHTPQRSSKRRSSNECKPSEPEPFNPLMEFEDKFDKIKRKAREKAQAAQEAITAAITTRGSKRAMKKNRSKSRKSKGTHEEHSKSGKSVNKDSSINKKRSHGSLGQKANSKKVLTKGALKGFDGVKVSILTNEINLHSILDNNKSITHEHSSKNFNSFGEKSDRAESNVSDVDKGTNDSDETINSKMTKKQRTKKLSSKQKRNKVHQESDRSTVNNAEPITPTNADKQHLDVYDFFDEDEDDISDKFKFRTPATLCSKDRVSTNKKNDNLSTSALSPNKNNLEAQNEDSQISSLSFSDRDDFTYMSDDYRANESEDETNHSSVDMSANTSKSNKKHKRASKSQTNTKKSAIMGRIFKNNAIRNDQKNANHNANETESDDVVTTGQTDMDQLFDSLLEQTIANNNESKLATKKSSIMSEDSASRDAVATDLPEDADVRSPSADEYFSDNDESIDKDIPPYPRVSKRKIVPRLKARSSDDELPRNPSPAKQPVPKTTQEDDDDTGDIGVASHKSQRKCTTGKQNVLVESWSSESDYEDFRQFEEYSSIPRTQGHHRKPRRSGRNRHSEDGKNSASDQNTKSDLGDQVSTSEKNHKIRFTPDDDKNHKNFQESADTNSDSFRNQSPCEENYPEKSSERQSSNSGRRVSFNTSNPVPNKGRSSRRKRRQSQKPFDYDDEFKPTRIAEPPSTQRRNKRAASEMLYYWSSSSEDDAQSASVDNNSRDPEPIEQHGWIVGDSHKKLVTMLAHAKGRKIDDNATVKEKRSRPST